MAVFYVKVKDKGNKNAEMVLRVDGQPTKEAAKAHIENHPRSVGGTHAGFEVVAVSETPSFEEAKAE